MRTHLYTQYSDCHYLKKDLFPSAITNDSPKSSEEKSKLALGDVPLGSQQRFAHPCVSTIKNGSTNATSLKATNLIHHQRHEGRNHKSNAPLVAMALVRPSLKLKRKSKLVAQRFSVTRKQPREHDLPFVEGVDCFGLLLLHHDILLPKAYATPELNAGDLAAIAQFIS